MAWLGLSAAKMLPALSTTIECMLPNLAAAPVPSTAPLATRLPAIVVTTPVLLILRMVVPFSDT